MEIINLNGEEYVKRSKVAALEKEAAALRQSKEDLETIRRVVGESFKDLLPILNIQKTQIEDAKEHQTKVLQPKVKSKKKIKSTQRRTKISDDDIFKVFDSAKKLWKISRMNSDGTFISKAGKLLSITIQDVLKVQKLMSRNTTVGEVKKLQKELDLRTPMINRLIYNYQEHVFDKYIKQWNSKTSIKPKKLPIENNPEKRKEAGIYGI